MPALGSASISSPLAASMASRVPILERWTAWTAVTTPIRGRAMAASSAISPPTYMPISRATASCSGPRRRSVRGRPISLFWLPSLFSVRNWRASTAATASLVEVLAMLPVIPTTSGSNRARQVAARAPRAAIGSATAMTATSGGRTWSGGRSRTTTAAAPAAAAAARWRWPSVRSPASATNSWPGSMSRESTAAPRIGREASTTRRPPVIRAISAADSVGGAAGFRDVRWASVTAPSVAQRLTGPRSRQACRAAGPSC